jgi:ubiquinone/menaquinone biosynthesis C-methylase UbiE
MEKNADIKIIVKEKYSEIAESTTPQDCCGLNASSCCSPSVDFTVFSDDYANLEGYNPDADMNLGCGIPTEFAGIKKGDTVVDLGSGAGNDVFVARALVGETGRVLGLDFTESMIKKAEINKAKLGYENIEFCLGDIENMPFDNNIADVLVSNCVLNLVPDKAKAFSEIYRILKPGGHFCISDVVLQGELTKELKSSAVLYAGCVSGALQQDEYLKIIKEAGFKNIEIKKTKKIELPEEMLLQYLTPKGMEEYKQREIGIFSITVIGIRFYIN